MILIHTSYIDLYSVGIYAITHIIYMPAEWKIDMRKNVDANICSYYTGSRMWLVDYNDRVDIFIASF